MTTFDVNALYEKSKSVAKAAVLRPERGYGLEDVMDERSWDDALASPMISTVPLNATLSGCVEALREKRVPDTVIAAVSVQRPVGTLVTDEDLRIARAWLSDFVAVNVDDDGQENLVMAEALERGWVGNPERLSSLILALVLVAIHASAANSG